MKLHFTKMHGLGNDFVVIDATREAIELSEAQYQLIADRHFGIGCDQILIVERSARDDIDFRYRIINSDGGEVEQCGNGSRCFVRYVHQTGLSDKNPIRVETKGGEITLTAIENSKLVQVDMGAPRFAPKQIPITANDEATTYQLSIDSEEVEFSVVSMGNPHAVLIVDNVCTAPVESLGPKLERHKFFPERANIGFMEIRSRSEIGLRVFERGVGETLACGTGACAAVASGIRRGLLDEEVTAYLNGGALHIRWQGEGHPVLMTGPAETVYQGTIDL